MELALQLLSTDEIPREPEWLAAQPLPVIAYGEGPCEQADVLVAEESEATALIAGIEKHPRAALVLVQVLRAVESLPVQAAMSVESMAYALLQAGSEYRRWLQSRDSEPALVTGGAGPAILIGREGGTVTAQLNRPENRNSLSVEMRDALVELFQLVHTDTTIERLELSGAGGCFSVGGELREFGLSGGVDEAHMIRSLHNPGRLLARISDKVHCHLHSACIGSGIELPAFAGTVLARRNSFFQLPELQFGLIPGAGGCVSIARRIGRQRTAWLALSGKKINSATAREWGLIDGIVD